MPISHLDPSALRVTIDPESLGFSETSVLLHYPLSWIGQERAETAAHFGLGMAQADYHLFVLGEVGSGRSSLLTQAMAKAAADRAIPPDLCYLYNFEIPEKPLAIRLPAGRGRILRQHLMQLIKSLPMEISQRLDGHDFKIKSENIENKFKEEEAKAYAELDGFADARHFTIRRDTDQLSYTLLDKKGEILTEDKILLLPKVRRVEIDHAELELREAIIHYFDRLSSFEKTKNAALTTLQRRVVKPFLSNALKKVRHGLQKQIKDFVRLSNYLDQVMQDILDNLTLFKNDDANEERQQAELDRVFSRYQINLIVDNHDLNAAPVIIEDNPLFRSLFGSIEYQFKNGILNTDFTRIRAGSLLKAHGGFLMLHLSDLLVDGLVWDKLRRFLRSNHLQIEEPGSALASNMAASLEPEVIDVDVKVILIGSREQYYAIQEQDPEFARRFRVKVDFAESFASNAETYRASSIFVAQVCQDLKLPHFSAAAVARLIEESHREVNDQSRQSAIFARTEMLVMESAALCGARAGDLVGVHDIESALQARTLRHNYPDQRLQESIAAGDVLIPMHGEKVGQLNGLTVMDLGDHSFGIPIRITARTFAGEEGLLNIEREVEMSGPIHDKGVFILQNYLAALFAHIAPLALNASIVFEQEYNSIEGDSASCAELYVLLSSLSGLPLKQGIAVTGAVNQYGEVMPVGGINEKIEGYFRICEKAGLDGNQGVLIPHQNYRHLMLDHKVIEAVGKGLFHIYSMQYATEGIELLTDLAAGIKEEEVARSVNYPPDCILGYAQKTLLAYREACLKAQQSKSDFKRFPRRSEK
ncbi:MAG: ATP-binding protein [Nitrosomonas sp.]|nr:ATP-binding protein [Nitrosomonas sp.]MDP1950128.1 ATP-binding protein [Nitrosomonas sp.]